MTDCATVRTPGPLNGMPAAASSWWAMSAYGLAAGYSSAIRCRGTGPPAPPASRSAIIRETARTSSSGSVQVTTRSAGVGRPVSSASMTVTRPASASSRPRMAGLSARRQ